MSRARRAALGVAAAFFTGLGTAGAAAPAAAAAPGPGLEVGMEDQRLLLDDPGRAASTAARWAAEGVDAVRIHARWWQIAPSPTAKRRPRKFRPGDHEDPRYDWAALDNAVRAVRGSGMEILLTVTGPGPLWTSRAPRRRDPTWKPDPRAYASFARAVARRYRGEISRYLVWNEPNIPGWLSPQNACRGSGASRVCVPESPHLYRALVRAAVPELRKADPEADVVIGELAPIGDPLRHSSSIVAPLRFLRDFGCVDSRFRALRGGRCARFRPAAADAFGHHPHPKRSAPDKPSRDPDWAKLADLPRLERTLDRLTAARRIRGPRRLDIHLTEFGYQSSPPDHFSGIPAGRQAAWLQQANYIAWRDPRVKSLVHYQWEDEPVRWRGPGSVAYAGWQSGLLYVTGETKPAYFGFRAPLVVRRPTASGAAVWAHVRPGGRHEVTFERRRGSRWSALATVRSSADGVISRRLPLRAGDRLRMRWPAEEPEGAALRSGTVRVAASSGAALAAPSRFPAAPGP